jgi:hypothetical protein
MPNDTTRSFLSGSIMNSFTEKFVQLTLCTCNHNPYSTLCLFFTANILKLLFCSSFLYVYLCTSLLPMYGECSPIPYIAWCLHMYIHILFVAYFLPTIFYLCSLQCLYIYVFPYSLFM